MRNSILMLLLLAVAPAGAQDTPAPLDGPNHPFVDDLLDHLAGAWKGTGQMRGQATTHSFDAEWVLNHQFLRLHEKDSSGASTYEADAYIGYDNMSERYVIHWIDVFGGRIDETLGYGQRSGNSIRFLFEYPDGPFASTLTWKPAERRWQLVMESKNKRGQWGNFGTLELVPADASQK
jgi:hypothetical protein